MVFPAAAGDGVVLGYANIKKSLAWAKSTADTTSMELALQDPYVKTVPTEADLVKLLNQNI